MAKTLVKTLMRRLWIWALIAVLGATTAAVMPALAQGTDQIIDIPLVTTVRADPGTTTTLAEVDVPTELVGKDCAVEARAENNSSVHPGNDLIVSSGGSQVLLADVEREPGVVTTSTAKLHLGTTVSLALHMGDHGIFSGGASAHVMIDCDPPATTTITTTTTTTTTAAPTTTTAAPTTTTAAPTTTTTPQVQGTTQLAVTGNGSLVLFAAAGFVFLDLGYLAASVAWPARRRRSERSAVQ